MYSLDQVIYFLEQRQQTEDWNIRDAAIAYLKGYREILPEYAQMKLDAVNDPLTWDELKSMVGKPVWLVYKKTEEAEWVLVGEWFDDDEMRICRMFRDYADYISKEIYEDGIWQAYRKERE